MTSNPVVPRKDAILAAATEQFARHGFRGASLRDIARDAGVSLTLLNHHFGTKASLLGAVVALNRPMLRQRGEVVRRLRATGLGLFEPSDLVRAWAAIAFEASARPDGLRFMRLLSRMSDDGSEEAAPVRDALDDAAQAFVEALRLCYPDASRRGAVSACRCVDAALFRIVTNPDPARDTMAPERTAVDRVRLERFLVAGIEAALSRPEPLSSVSSATDTGLMRTRPGNPIRFPGRWPPRNVVHPCLVALARSATS